MAGIEEANERWVAPTRTGASTAGRLPLYAVSRRDHGAWTLPGGSNPSLEHSEKIIPDRLTCTPMEHVRMSARRASSRRGASPLLGESMAAIGEQPRQLAVSSPLEGRDLLIPPKKKKKKKREPEPCAFDHF